MYTYSTYVHIHVHVCVLALSYSNIPVGGTHGEVCHLCIKCMHCANFCVHGVRMYMYICGVCMYVCVCMYMCMLLGSTCSYMC